MSLSAIVDKIVSLGSGSPDVTPADFETSARRITRERMHYPILAGAGVITAGTALAEATLGAVRQKSRLVRAHLVSSAAITANSSNYLTIVGRKRTAATPGTQVAVFSLPLDTATTDDIAAWTRYSILDAAGVTLGVTAAFDFTEGDIFTLEVTKTGTGLSLPIGDIHVEFEPRDLA